MARRVIIIAEAGVNHNGSIETAKKLIEVASDSGADFVKFQTFKTEKIISPKAQKAAYQIKNTEKEEETQFEMIKKLELNEEAHNVLNEHCIRNNIKFLSTAFDSESLELLHKYKLPFFKIPSGEITNLPFLEEIASLKKPIVMSTGMSTLGEIEMAINVMINKGLNRNDLTILHCNTEYPTPMKDVNLKAMVSLKNAFKVEVGYSDHTLGIEVPVAAVAMGATVIEKHFTLSKSLEGPDHKASLEPRELKKMISSIRNIEKALGNGIKEPSNSERKNIQVARKSIHMAKYVKRNDVVKFEDLEMKRPGSGISPMDINKVIGKIAKRNLKVNEMISLSDLKTI